MKNYHLYKVGSFAFFVAINWFFLSAASAAELKAQYSIYNRYNLVGQLTGTFSSGENTDGTGIIVATRNTYNAQGLLEKVESGTLTAHQDESIAPSDWSGFSVQLIKSYTYSNAGLKLSESTKAGAGASQKLTQLSYNKNFQLECVAQRMNPAVYSTLTADACLLGTEGDYGPDRITKYTYKKKQLQEERRAYGTDLAQAYATYTYLNDYAKADSVTDANGNYTKMVYDAAYRLTYMYFPSKTEIGKHSETDYESYTYDINGNRETLRKRDGKEIIYEYDFLNRVVKKDIPGTDTGDVYYDYDLRNLQLYAHFGSKTGVGLDYVYTGFGELKEEKNNLNGNNFKISHSYDANGNREKITHPDNNYFFYNYDGLNRLANIKENGSSILISQTYDTKGRFETSTTSGGVITKAGYDDISRVNNIDYQVGGTAYDLNAGFTFSPANQIVEQVTNNDTYLYKEPKSFSSDYHVANGLNQYQNIDGKIIVHDDNANLLDDGSLAYGYDVENRLVSVLASTPTSPSYTLTYDPAGRLSTYTINDGANSKTTSFLYSGDSLIGEYENGQLTRRYVFGMGVDKPLVSYSGSSVNAASRQFLHANHQGSIILSTDNAGNKLYTNTYDSYGVPASANQGRFSYTGQIFLPGIDMYHYKARIYSPKIGRFLQTDPVGYKDQMNLYSYVGSDPVNKIDPSGKWIVALFRFIFMQEAKKQVKNEIRSEVKDVVSDTAKKEVKQDIKQEVKEAPKDLKLEPGTTQRVDPNTLSTDKGTLDAKRLETQQELQQTGTPRNSSVVVDQTGNIYDGTHATRAASESGNMIEVRVVELPNAKPGARFVIDLPIIGQ